MLTSRPYEERDFSFFLECANSSPEWQEVESQGNNLEEYMESYKNIDGHWLIWSKEDIKIGITFTVNRSPSNGRPWIGTLLIHPSYRNIGFGHSIVNQLLRKWANEGERIVYAAIPIMMVNWSKFLANCGFEQYKIEKEEGNTYLLFIKPNDKNRGKE